MIDINLAKQHLRVDYDDENDYIQDCIDSAKASCFVHLNCTVCLDDAELKKAHESGDKHAILLTKDINRAILLMIGLFFEEREGIEVDMPRSVKSLLNPYRKRAGL